MSHNHVDTHPGIVKVDFQEGNFTSRLLAARVRPLWCSQLTDRTSKPENWLPALRKLRPVRRRTRLFRSQKMDTSRFAHNWKLIDVSWIRTWFTWITLARQMPYLIQRRWKCAPQAGLKPAPPLHSFILAQSGIWHNLSNVFVARKTVWDWSVEQKTSHVQFSANTF